MGRSPNAGINVSAGTSGPAVTVEIACRQTTTQSFAQKEIKWRFSKALALQKHGIQCEKAVKHWCGPDATAMGRKEATQADFADLGHR